jgi:DNA-binding IclR family transcriptional regulator
MKSAVKRPADKKTTGPEYAVPALEKGLDVLEMLSQTRHALGLNGIATALNRSRQELFRVVTHLAQRGYLLRDSAGNYRLTSKMLEVGSRHIAQQAVVAQAMPAMEMLAEKTGESCQLSLLGRERMVVAANAAGFSHLQLEIKVGSSIPVYYSVIGLVALAYSGQGGDEATWARRQELQRQGDDVMDPQLKKFSEWQERLAAIRRAGQITSQSPAHVGSRVHAAPLLDSSGKLHAVLSIARLLPVREERGRDAVIDRALLECCQTITAQLGNAQDAELVG